MTGTGSPSYRTEIALLGVLSLLWGASYAFIRVGVETIPPLTFIAARTAIAAAALSIVLRWRHIAFPRDARLWRRFLYQACLNSVVPFTLIAWAEQHVTAGIATILNASAPIFAFVLTRWGQGGNAATARQLFGVFCGLTGTLIILGVEAFSGIDRQLVAELAIVAATVCYAGAAVFGRAFAGMEPMLPAAGSLLCGAILLLPISVVTDRPWTLSPSARSIFALICLALLSTALALTLYFRLIRTLGTVGATSQAYLRVPVGVISGAVLLDEPIGAATLIGLVFVIAGVAAMTLPSERGTRDASTRR